MIPFPKLPEFDEPILFNRFVYTNDHGEHFATRNFSDTTPVWKKYKRFGWAVRYAFGRSLKDVKFKTVNLFTDEES